MSNKYTINLSLFILFTFILVSESTSLSSFQFTLLKELIKTQPQPDSNICISPISLYQILSLSLNGANGQTQQEILDIITPSNSATKSVEETNKNNEKIIDTFSNSQNIKIANAILSKIPPEESFILLSKKYKALCDKLTDISQINKWVSENTQGKITSIVDSIKDIDLILLNAVYFKGEWKTKFNKKDTKKMKFYTTKSNKQGIEVDMMFRRIENAHYYMDFDVQMIELPYSNNDLSAIILLPNLPWTVNDFILKKLDKDTLNEYIKCLDEGTNDTLHLYLPRFNIEYKSSMEDALKNMGMKLAFDHVNADFSNLCKVSQLFISEFIHKTYMNVDENGTEAAAATAAVFARSMPLMIRVVRPFLFMVRNKKLNTLVFISKIDDIKQ